MFHTGDIASGWQQEISYLAEAYGGPTFPPHVTLIGGITGSEEHAISVATRLAATLQVGCNTINVRHKLAHACNV